MPDELIVQSSIALLKYKPSEKKVNSVYTAAAETSIQNNLIVKNVSNKNVEPWTQRALISTPAFRKNRVAYLT